MEHKKLTEYTKHDLMKLCNDSTVAVYVGEDIVDIPRYAETIAFDDALYEKTERVSDDIIAVSETPVDVVLIVAEYLRTAGLPVDEIECITSTLLKCLSRQAEESATNAAQLLYGDRPDSLLSDLDSIAKSMVSNYIQRTQDIHVTKVDGNVFHVDFKK